MIENPAANLAISRPLLPVTVSDNSVLWNFGVENIASLIADGQKYSDIAKTLGVSTGVMNSWKYNLPQNFRELLKAAEQSSAEALFDQADDILDAPIEDRFNAARGSLRVERAKSRRLRAGIRDPAYSATGRGAAGPVTQVQSIVNFQIVQPDAATVAKHRELIESE